MSLSSLQAKISQVRKNIHFLITIQGISRVALWILLLATISFILDYFLNLPRAGRSIILISCLVFLVYKLMINLAPLKTSIADDDVLLAVEKANPYLKEKLISAFQFSRLLTDPEYQDSKTMSQAVIRDAEEIIDEIDFSTVLSPGKPLLIAFVPILALVVLGILWTIFPAFSNLSGIWSKRNVLLQNTAWPRRTYVHLLKENFSVGQDEDVIVKIVADPSHSQSSIALWQREEKARYRIWKQQWLTKEDEHFTANLGKIRETTNFYLECGEEHSSLYQLTPSPQADIQSNTVEIAFPDRNIIKARGKNLYLKVAIRGQTPSSAWIHYRVEQGEWHRAALTQRRQGSFKYVFQTLTENLSFYFTGGDDNDLVPMYKVTVLNPPTTQEVALWYKYPDYTGLPATPYENPKTQGNIRALIGTQISLRITPNIEISEAKLVFSGKNKSLLPNLLLQKKPLIKEIRGEDLDLYATFVANYNSRYQILLTAANGLVDPSPATFYIHVTRDLPPFVQFIVPSKYRLEMTANGTLPLRLKTTDDYGITGVAILHRVNRQENWQRFPLTQQHNTGEYGSKEIQSQYILDMSSIKVEADGGQRKLVKGDRIVLKAEARDNNNVSGQSVKNSKIITIEIFEKRELMGILNEKLQEVKRQLRKIAESQQRFREMLEDFNSIDANYEAGDIARILQLHFSQRTISRDVTESSHDIADILQTAEYNSLWDLYTKNRVTNVRDIVKSIADETAGVYGGKSGAVGELLMKSYNIIRTDAPAGKKLLTQAIAEQNGIEASLEEAIRLLGEWENFNEVLQDLEEILEYQKKIEPKIKKLISGGK